MRPRSSTNSFVAHVVATPETKRAISATLIGSVELYATVKIHSSFDPDPWHADSRTIFIPDEVVSLLVRRAVEYVTGRFGKDQKRRKGQTSSKKKGDWRFEPMEGAFRAFLEKPLRGRTIDWLRSERKSQELLMDKIKHVKETWKAREELEDEEPGVRPADFLERWTTATED